MIPANIPMPHRTKYEVKDGYLIVTHRIRVKGNYSVRHTVHAHIYDQDGADKHGVKYLHWRNKELKEGDYALFDDGYVAEILRIYDYKSGARIITTGVGSSYSATDEYNLYPFVANAFRIRDFAHIFTGTIWDNRNKIKLYDKLFVENKTIEEAYKELVPNAKPPNTINNRNEFILWLNKVVREESMQDVIETKLKEELHMQVERSIENINEVINTALERVGVSADTIAAKLSDIMHDENPKIALEAIKEINKLRNMYPSKTRITESGGGTKLRISSTEKNAIKEALKSAE